jgi:choline dehydrogenase-like flavoprotein
MGYMKEDYQLLKNDANTFQAIVIGSGISGGWVAKELCDKGIATLMLERGRDVRHLRDYPTATTDPWEFPNRVDLPLETSEKNPIASRCYAFDDATKHFFVKDEEHPYIQEKPFDWIRGYQLGGRSLIWARQTQRWSRFEFEKPSRDGYSIPWPISYDDLAPWYSHVEKFVGISGQKNGLEVLPDSEVLPAWEMNKAEASIANFINENYPDRHAVIGRCAHLTEPKPIHQEQGRGKCQARNLCYRGCPYGGYFSSNSGTIPWAEKSGNLTVKTDAVVHSIIYDDDSKKAIGVKVIDRLTKEERYYFSEVVFLNAGSINSNLILLNSTSDRFPTGLSNDYDVLGRYMAFHHYRGSLTARYNKHLDSYFSGRRPTSIMIPNFRNINRQDTDFQGGYMTFYSTSREGWSRQIEGQQYGVDYKRKLSKPGPWSVYMMMQGETIPKASNRVYLSKDQVDEWDIPLIVTAIDYDDNDERMLQDFLSEGKQMLYSAGCEDITAHDSQQAPGLDIHTMGGIRMGSDPTTSMVDRHCRLHQCQNVYVTDGSCMSSTGVQNPSLTYMALSARAAEHASLLF